jgi:hypothetical protein
MNFLFDQSADFRLIPHLQSLGHDVQAISRDYPQGLADEDVLAIARQSPLRTKSRLEQIQKFLGHAQLDTTQIYAASTSAMIKESYQQALSR